MMQGSTNTNIDINTTITNYDNNYNHNHNRDKHFDRPGEFSSLLSHDSDEDELVEYDGLYF